MAGSQSPFARQLTPLPNPLFFGLEFFSHTAPNTTYQVTWNVPMNTGLSPPAHRWRFRVDGVDRNCQTLTWQDSTHLTASYVGPVGATRVELYLLVANVNLQSATGDLAQPVQSDLLIP